VQQPVGQLGGSEGLIGLAENSRFLAFGRQHAQDFLDVADEAPMSEHSNRLIEQPVIFQNDRSDRRYAGYTGYSPVSIRSRGETTKHVGRRAQPLHLRG